MQVRKLRLEPSESFFRPWSVYTPFGYYRFHESMRAWYGPGGDEHRCQSVGEAEIEINDDFEKRVLECLEPEVKGEA